LALQRSLDSLGQWFVTWKMPVNVGKCAVVKFGRPNEQLHADYVLHGTVLKISQAEKDLGVIMSSMHGYKLHIQAVANKAIRVYGWIVRNLASRDIVDEVMKFAGSYL
jgi:hypothetical protein